MTPAEIQGLATAIGQALQQSRSVSDSEHYDHHRWISERIVLEKQKIAFWKALGGHLVKWGAVACVSVIFYALWLYFKQVVSQ